MKLQMGIFISKNSFLIFSCLFSFIQLCIGQIDLDRLAKSNKSSIIIINVPSGQPVSFRSINGDMNFTESGNYYMTYKTEVRNKIIKEFTTPYQNTNNNIDKSIIDNVLNNQDTSILKYRKSCEYLKSEIRLNIEKNFPIAIDQALKLEKLAKDKNEASLLANTYAMLFLMYVTKDFKEYAMPFGILSDSLLEKLPFDELYTNETYDLLSKGYYLLQNDTKVIEIENNALSINFKNRYYLKESVAKSYTLLGRIYYQKIKNNDSALIYLEKAIKILDLLPHGTTTSFQSEAYYHYSLIKNKNDINRSFIYIRKCLDVAVRRKDTMYIAYAYHTIGYYFSIISKRDSSLYYSHKSLSLKRKYQMSHNTIGCTLQNIGFKYLNENNFDSAYKYFSESLLEFERDTFHDISNEMSCKLRIGMSGSPLTSSKNISLLRQALLYYKAKDSIVNWETRTAYFYLGKQYNKIGDFNKAITCLDTAIFLTKKYGKEYQFLHHYYWERAISYRQINNFQLALKNVDTAIYYYHNQSNHNKNDIISLLNMQSEYYSELFEFTRSIRAQETIIQQIGQDSTLLKLYYLNTINNISYYSSELEDSTLCIQYLLKAKNYIESTSTNDLKNISYKHFVRNSEKIRNYHLALYFLNKEKGAILSNNFELKQKKGLIIDNELQIIKFNSKINPSFNKLKSLRLLEKKNDNKLAHYYDNYANISFEKMLSFASLNQLDSVYNISKNLLYFIQINKSKVTNKTFFISNFMISWFDVAKLVTEKNYPNALLKLKSIVLDCESIAKENKTTLSLSLYRDLLLGTGKLCMDDELCLLVFQKEALFYTNVIDSISRSDLFYNIVDIEYRNFKTFSYLDSLLKYQNLINKEKRIYLTFLNAQKHIKFKNYTQSLAIINGLNLSIQDKYFLQKELLKMLCYIQLEDFKKAESLLNDFKLKYISLINENKELYKLKMNEIMLVIIEKKYTNLFQKFLKEFEKYQSGGNMVLYWVYYYISIGDESQALNFLDHTTPIHNFKCNFLKNDPFLEKIKNTEKFKTILNKCLQ